MKFQIFEKESHIHSLSPRRFQCVVNFFVQLFNDILLVKSLVP